MDEFDDTRMEDLAEKYPEYDDMDISNLINRYNELTDEQTTIESGNGDPTRLDEINEEKNYLQRLQERKNEDIEGRLRRLREEDSKTVTIDRSKSEPRPAVVKRKEQRSSSDPEVMSTPPDVESINPINAIQDFIQRNYNIENFRFDPYNETAIELRLNIDTTKNNNIRYKPVTARGKRGFPQIVLKHDPNGVLQFNDAKIAKRAVEQFKQVIEEIIDRENSTREMPMINTSIQIDDIDGLTPTEMREYRGVMNPSETILPETRQTALQAQADHFQEEIYKTKKLLLEKSANLDTTEQIDDFNELLDRQRGLEKARDDTLKQIQLEEEREQQEGDVTRLQKFKKWAKENMVGLTALSVSIAGIITTLIIGGRKAIVQGAQATSRFGKAISDLGKKLWPVLGPILSIIGTAISWGAKGLAWLASNLWVLAIAFAWLIYDQYKERRKRKKNKT